MMASKATNILNVHVLQRMLTMFGCSALAKNVAYSYIAIYIGALSGCIISLRSVKRSYCKRLYLA